ncbi:hypothetical protein NUW54_g2174 [Trametes sanguinea]|uniref:Uncharacterized protein n=1 Tax=Trametes sanguinea TaxID=158606 RepID=A0ACC1Q4I6_9APHY|nr:hypothetical protein NUW54_g2174 [Trametes sanguinea]
MGFTRSAQDPRPESLIKAAYEERLQTFVLALQGKAVAGSIRVSGAALTFDSCPCSPHSAYCPRVLKRPPQEFLRGTRLSTIAERTRSTLCVEGSWNWPVNLKSDVEDTPRGDSQSRRPQVQARHGHSSSHELGFGYDGLVPSSYSASGAVTAR